MSFTYYRVGKELWGSKAIGESTAKQLESVKSKKKVSMTLLSYALCTIFAMHIIAMCVCLCIHGYICNTLLLKLGIEKETSQGIFNEYEKSIV